MLYYIFAAPNAAALGLNDYRAFPFTAAAANFPRENAKSVARAAPASAHGAR